MKRINVYSVKLVKESGALYDLKTRIARSPEDAHRIVNAVLDLESEPNEKFGILCLSTKNEINGVHVIFSGSLNSSIVHPREVFQHAILNNSASIILFHNHPSGHPEPSIEDKKVTKRIVNAGQILGIDVLDHIIVGHDNRFYSMKEKGDI